MLINLSNHPVSEWSPEQLAEAEKSFGKVISVPYPLVPPAGSEDEIQALAGEICRKVITAYGRNITIHVMGEMTLLYALLELFRAQGIPCLASTTERKAVLQTGGTKESVFKFVRFRNYF